MKEVPKTSNGRARVVKVNMDKNSKAPRYYNVSAVPTFMVIKKGNILWRHAGMIDKSSLMNVFTQNA
jgi:thioredoxin 1